MLFGFTQRSVWSIRAPLPPALLPGSGWPSPGQVHWAARPGPCVWIGTRIEWPESPRCESLTPPAPHSETLSPTYRTTARKHRLMYHFNHRNTSEATAFSYSLQTSSSAAPAAPSGTDSVLLRLPRSRWTTGSCSGCGGGLNASTAPGGRQRNRNSVTPLYITETNLTVYLPS